MKAVEEAYKNQVMIGKYPMVVLNLEINPQLIDINVHPTKLEVKFSKDGDVYRSLYHAVKNSLYALPNVPKIERIKETKTEFERDSAKTADQIEMNLAKEPTLSFENISKTDIDSTTRGFEPEKGLSWDKADMVKKCESPKPVYQKAELTSYKVDASSEYFEKKQRECNESKADEKSSYNLVAETLTKSEYEQEIENQIPDEVWGFDAENIRIVGQIFDSYILAESGDTMIIADQHAAHERLKYEELKRELSSKTVTPQILMFPVICDLSPSEYVCYLENEQEIADMGFEIESFGSNSLLVRATPEALDEEDLKQVILEIIDNFANNKSSAITEKMERSLYTIACKAAVKANHKFDNGQLEKLLKEVLSLKNINTCPHGRPIIITMTKKELEKEFKRVL